MKKWNAGILGLALVLGSAAMAGDRDVTVGVQDAYIPSGQDSRSDAMVVVSGLYPNGCYRWKDAAVTHDATGLVHEVHVTATVHSGMCIMVLVPFNHEVHLGHLRPGDHQIRFVGGDGTYLEKPLHID